jgi:hypothetical protein
VKMKGLVVVTLLVLGCGLASAQTFGFASAGGVYLFCNYEQLSGGAEDIWSGIDNLSVCNLKPNATLIGFGATTPNKGQPAFGKGVVLADNLYDAYSYTYTGVQEVLFTKLKCNKVDQFGHFKGAPGWMVVVAISGFMFGDNYGALSCSIPKAGDRAAMSRGPIAGRMPARQKK